MKGSKGLITKTWERCKSIGRGHKTSSSSSLYNYNNNNSNENIGSLSFTTSTKMSRSRSWPNNNVDITTNREENKKKLKKKTKKVVPEKGCFSVYVGGQLEMQRFVMKAEYANHPLFKILLEEAELEYGYSSQGPLVLPCKVEIFYKVLAQIMDQDEGRLRSSNCNSIDEEQTSRQGCASFGMRSPRSYQLL